MDKRRRAIIYMAMRDDAKKKKKNRQQYQKPVTHYQQYDLSKITRQEVEELNESYRKMQRRDMICAVLCWIGTLGALVEGSMIMFILGLIISLYLTVSVMNG